MGPAQHPASQSPTNPTTPTEATPQPTATAKTRAPRTTSTCDVDPGAGAASIGGPSKEPSTCAALLTALGRFACKGAAAAQRHQAPEAQGPCLGNVQDQPHTALPVPRQLLASSLTTINNNNINNYTNDNTNTDAGAKRSKEQETAV